MFWQTAVALENDCALNDYTWDWLKLGVFGWHVRHKSVLCSCFFIYFTICLMISLLLIPLYPPSPAICLPVTILSPPLSTSLHSHFSPPLHLPVFPNSHLTFHYFFPPSYLCTSFFLSLYLHIMSQVDWPLNIIITDSCMNKYNRLFSFLLQLKHMVWSLREVWFHLKRTGEKVGTFDPGPT